MKKDITRKEWKALSADEKADYLIERENQMDLEKEQLKVKIDLEANNLQFRYLELWGAEEKDPILISARMAWLAKSFEKG